MVTKQVMTVVLICDECGREFHGTAGQEFETVKKWAEVAGWTFPVTGSMFCRGEGATGSADKTFGDELFEALTQIASFREQVEAFNGDLGIIDPEDGDDG